VVSVCVGFLYIPNTLPITHNEKEKEWSIIQCIAHNNGFPLKIIHRLRQQIENKTNTSQTETVPRTWVTFTFNSPVVHKITNLFKNTNINTAYRASNTIRRILQPRFRVDPFTQSGIYQIKCVSCNGVYVGQSGREIRTRYREHIGYILNHKSLSEFAQHISNHNQE
jgi:hypothetical protein